MAVLKIRDENGRVHEVVALRGEKGADGTVAFDELTDEQKASLKGDKGDQGEQGIQGEKGDKGDSGYTPLKGIDYYTEADIAELIKQIAVPVDQEFDPTSRNAIANLVVYNELIGIHANIEGINSRLQDEVLSRVEAIEQQLGGVETALDGIIAIQNGLIGGDAI